MMSTKEMAIQLELNKMENIVCDDEGYLKMLRKVTEEKLLPISNLDSLNAILRIINLVAGVCAETFSDFDNNAALEFYLVCITRFSNRYCAKFATVEHDYYELYQKIVKLRTDALMELRWDELIPSWSDKYTRDDLAKEPLLQMLDDFFDTIVSNIPDKFLVELKDLHYMMRGRRGIRSSVNDIIPPSTEVAVKLNAINRWNPPNKRYLYLGLSNSSCNNMQDVCLSELRATSGEEITFLNFSSRRQSRKKRVLNLNYQDITPEAIYTREQRYRVKRVFQITNELLKENMEVTTDIISEKVSSYREYSTPIVSELCGKLFLKEICDVVFVPLDENQDKDAELKNDAYRPFHRLAEYLEGRGIAGIIYPSTRMALRGESGQNLVLFNVDDAVPIESSLKTIIAYQ